MAYYGFHYECWRVSNSFQRVFLYPRMGDVDRIDFNSWRVASDGVCSTFGAHYWRDTGKFVELSFKFCSFSGLDAIVPFAWSFTISVPQIEMNRDNASALDHTMEAQPETLVSIFYWSRS